MGIGQLQLKQIIAMNSCEMPKCPNAQCLSPMTHFQSSLYRIRYTRLVLREYSTFLLFFDVPSLRHSKLHISIYLTEELFISILLHSKKRCGFFLISISQGKGTMLTYFLNGRDGFTKPLPDLCKAASLEDHNFK